MDFNNLSSKLQRLYLALDEQYSDDINDNIVDTHAQFYNGYFEHRTTFGRNDLAKNQYVIMNAIHHVAAFKDIIKAKIQDPQSFERLIDANPPLALITDLDNKDKHGDPLSRTDRSGKNPRITNISQALRGRGITRTSFTTDLVTGVTRMNKVEGDVKIVVMGDVIDSEGVFIMHLDKMLEDAVMIVENFMLEQGLV